MQKNIMPRECYSNKTRRRKAKKKNYNKMGWAHEMLFFFSADVIWWFLKALLFFLAETVLQNGWKVTVEERNNLQLYFFFRNLTLGRFTLSLFAIALKEILNFFHHSAMCLLGIVRRLRHARD